MDPAQLERLLADDYLGDLTTLPMHDLRGRRAECQELEVAVSYQRRIAQGRLDLVAAERRRRVTGDLPPDSEHLVAELSGILSDRTHAPGVGRLPQLPAPAAGELDTSELDAVAGIGVLGARGDSSDDELSHLFDALSAIEHEISGRRHALHERIDALQAEITRRYRTGEASVETLLQ
ncbi:hypothetical protein BH18ACT1_BH18ACT1_04820 [soil metagenome]